MALPSATFALSALLLLAAIAFGVGAGAERAQHPGAGPAMPGVVPDPNAEEGSPAREAAERGARAPTGDAAASQAREPLLGVDVEDPLVVGLGIGAGAATAGFVLVRPSRAAIIVAGLLALGSLALDGREAAHQAADADRLLLAAAAVVLALHGAAVGLAAWLLAGSPSRAGASPG
ncbi:MAG: hypothetical protein LC624_09945 [Halobacteriales archaeon]|nr:hypothetical protein [Halobacteriales archaeon]